MSASIDPNDVQGLVRFGYASHTEACYLLLRIRDAAAARQWCGVAKVATAELLPQAPPTAMQVAFTAEGLTKLGLSPDTMAQFSAEFLDGMAGDENRSQRLGDINANSPDTWLWGGGRRDPHVLVILTALPGRLQDWQTQVEDSLFNSAFELILRLETSDMKGHEPFGFTDGISQPQIDWSGSNNRVNDATCYSNLIKAGEFLLGYRNEYGKYTDRPLLNASERRAEVLDSAEDQPSKKDLGRNGTFLVMRTLEQDVQGFWRFLDLQTGSDAKERVRLAEQMVGRTMEGNPLVQTSATAIAGIPEDAAHSSNHFTFDEDQTGTRCPFGAHIRRANPRNSDYPNHPTWLLPKVWAKLGFASKGMLTDIMASSRFHRILRRGREYGSVLTPEKAIERPLDDTGKRGLHFVCLNANIGRQFEFIQNAWLMSAKFDGLVDETDPLLGNRAVMNGGRPTSNFGISEPEGVTRCLIGLPQFVTVRGGAYFFLPGIKALKYFSLMGT